MAIVDRRLAPSRASPSRFGVARRAESVAFALGLISLLAAFTTRSPHPALAARLAQPSEERTVRSLAFNIAFGLISVFHTLWAALAALTPGRGRVRPGGPPLCRRMVWAMDVFAGIRIEVRGARTPADRRLHPGPQARLLRRRLFSIYGQFDDLAFVTGDHLERFPLFKTVLNKLGAIVVDSCGGPEARRALTRTAAEAHAEGRKILIYPEGAPGAGRRAVPLSHRRLPHGPRFRRPGGAGGQQPRRLLAQEEWTKTARHRGAGIPRPHAAGPAAGASSWPASRRRSKTAPPNWSPKPPAARSIPSAPGVPAHEAKRAVTSAIDEKVSAPTADKQGASSPASLHQ